LDRSPYNRFQARKFKKTGRRAALTVDLSLFSFQRTNYISPSPNYDTVSRAGGYSGTF
jgi:hypothetical protein